MARIDTIEMIIENETYKYNINVTKTGWFRCSINWKVKKTLGIEDITIDSKTLDELKNKVLIPYHNYLESKKIDETYISITYKASGKFKVTNDSRFSDRSLASDGSRLMFDFNVYIKSKHSTGTESWYIARKGQGCVNYNEGDLSDPNKWYKHRSTFNVDGVLIPYSDTCYETLLNARNGLKGISDILFNVLNQDVELISSSLSGGNILNSSKKIVSKE